MEAKIITTFMDKEELENAFAVMEKLNKRHPDVAIKVTLVDEAAYEKCVDFAREASFFCPIPGEDNQKSS